MTTVALIVTGQCEQGLGHLLRRVFPGVTFEVRPVRDGFTSAELKAEPEVSPPARPTNLQKLAALLVAEVEPGRREAPADFVVLVDDLEPHNAAHPERAVAHVRTAVQHHIANHPWPSERSRVSAAERVRARCSFHLLVPMVEAYFFGDALHPEKPGLTCALDRAGARTASSFDAETHDVEAFVASDPPFVDPPTVGKHDLPAWARHGRDRHPKHYLQYLCDPEGAQARPYIESKAGRRALERLEVARVLARSEHARFFRSLIVDLADALDHQDLLTEWQEQAHPLTWSPTDPSAVLRNL